MHKFLTLASLAFSSIAGVQSTSASGTSAGSSPSQTLNNRPVIAILTLPCSGDSWCGSNNQYFPSSYAKSFQAAGARVIPLEYTWSSEKINSALDSVNGAFFTGGSANLNNGSTYFNAVESVYNYFLKANNEDNDYFPLIGTCLGFESITRAVSGDENILTDFDAENITLPLTFTPFALNGESRIFSIGGGVPKNLKKNSGNSNFSSGWASDSFQYLSKYNITMNNHQHGVTPSDFAANNALSSMFNILSTNVDRNGVEFVSFIEGKKLPIYAQQFHPEKTAFEWDPKEVIQHTNEAVVASGYLISYYVSEARRNFHVYSKKSESQFPLIDSFDPTFLDGEFVSVYLFP